MKIDKHELERFARTRDFDVRESLNSWTFSNDRMQVKIVKELDEEMNIGRIERVLNEAYGNGFAGAGSNCDPYVEYKILPLNHDLEQKVDKKAEQKNKKQSYNIQIASYVSGKAKSDGKIYSGQVVRFNRTNYNDIVTVYILAKETGRIIPLDPESVQLSSPYPKARPGRGIDMGNSIIPFMN